MRSGPTAMSARRVEEERVRWRGLTWDHPRGFAPLEALGGPVRWDRQPLEGFESHPISGPVRWDRQPLEGFESHPIDELADRFDLIVIDHPGIGSAVAAGCLRPIDELLSADELAERDDGTVGASFRSYRYEGRQWALPIDAATQVLAARSDLIEEELPATWSAVVELARRVPTAVPLAGPHALLAFLATCVALGRAPATGPDVLVERESGEEALGILREVVASSDERSAVSNPIQVLEMMVADDRIAFCPLVYGYVTYAVPRRGRPTLTFADAPRTPTGPIGSVLGGTGVAVSRRAEAPKDLADYLRTLTSADVQRDVVTASGGQPAARSAWQDPAVDAAAGGFFSATLASTESAWVRPRYPGYIAFQDHGSEIVRSALLGDSPVGGALEDLDDLYRRSRHHGEEGT